jgi:leader peptidase (prepilin peptidase)/N-methyltransferase
MNNLHLILGLCLGAVLGYLAWLASQFFIASYRVNNEISDGAEKASVTFSTSGLLFALGMACWSGYVAWRTIDRRILVAAIVVTAILLVVVLVDYAVHRIPNKVVIVLLIWAAGQMLWLGQPTVRAALLGVTLGGGVFLLFAILGRGALGMGDVKFVAAEGAILGFPLILHGMFWGIIFGGVAAFFLLITKRAGRKDSFAYGPYLALGAWLIFLSMLNLLPWQH